MATAYTSLLGLALPVTGELSGTWGDIVNDTITSLLDTAVAGTTSLTTDTDVTLTTTAGASNQARQAIILWNPASGTTTRNITAPAQSKIYTVINASGGTQSIVFRGAGPTTGVTIIKGESAQVAWNGSDFVKIGSSAGDVTVRNLTVTGTLAVSGATTLTGAFTANGNSTLGDAVGDTVTINGTATFSNANPTLTAGTANGVAYLNGSKVLTSGSALTFDGTKQTITSYTPAAPVELLRLSNSGAGDLTQAQITFYAASSNYAVITGGYNGAPSLISNVAAGGYQSWQIATNEQMRLTSTGLGIGTSSPVAKLSLSDSAGLVSNFNSTNASGVYTRYQNSGTSIGDIGSGAQAVGGSAGDFAITSRSGNLILGTASATKATLDSSGNLGLGVTPSAWGSSGNAQFQKLTFAGNDYSLGSNYYQGDTYRYASTDTAARLSFFNGQFLFYTAPSGTAGNAISFTQAMTLHASGGLSIGSTGDPGVGSLVLDGGSGAGRVTLAAVSGYNGILSTTTGFAAWRALQFFTKSGDASATIDTSGNFIVGKTSGNCRLDVEAAFTGSHAVARFGNNTASGAVGCVDTSLESNGNSTSSYHLRSVTQNVNIWYLYGNGTSSFTSDQRLKKNIATARDGYLDDLMQLRVVKYHWKNNDDASPKELGLIAQEVEQVFPGLVQEADVEFDGVTPKVLKGSVLPFMLLKAIQEQQAIIEDMKTRLAAAGI